MHFGPDEILLNLDVQFDADLQAAELVDVIDELETNIRDKYPDINRIFIEVEGFRNPKKDKLGEKDGNEHFTKTDQ